MCAATLIFSNHLTACDPQNQSVLILGKKNLFTSLEYDEISVKFGSKISKELYEEGVEALKNSSSDAIPLYLKNVTLIRVPSTCSRHNTPTQAHFISKVIKSHTSSRDEFIVILCEHKDIYASACAIAKCFPLYCDKKNGNARSVTVEFIVSNNDVRIPLTDSDVDCLTAAAEGVRTAAKIVDMPCSRMNTDTFLKEISQVGESLGIKPFVISGEDLKEQGFGGLYSVGQAAEHPPALAILSHISKDAKETIAWVGKGIVYDTGGLFLKTRAGMPGMKRDCGGAATILGAFYAAVKGGFKENLHAIFCLAENAIGPKATRPDDVITMYSGKTVEISNPDAEGRLVVGDGVAYARKELKATTIVDMATLTGAQGICTGRFHAAVLTNDEACEVAAVAAGKLSGDLLHPVPYSPELHFSEYNSTVADMKNSVADVGNASVSCAGLFIGSHLGFDFEGKWIHVDFAKTAYVGERATGFGVALLNVLFGSASNTPLLQKLSSDFDRGDGA